METATGPIERQAEQTGPIERAGWVQMERQAESNGDSTRPLETATGPMERQAEQTGQMERQADSIGDCKLVQ